MRRVVAVPEVADAEDHRVARVAGVRAEPRRLACWVQPPLEYLPIDAGSRADGIPAAVDHLKAPGRAENKRCLQAACHFAGLRVGAQGDTPRFPVPVGEL